MRMRFASAIVAGLLLPAVFALAADGPQPGLWKVTVTAETDGVAAPARASERCLKPEQVKDIGKSFVPEQGADCARMAYEWTGRRLAWRIVCKAPVAMDNSGWYAFDSPRHYTGELIVQMVVPGGTTMLSRTRIEGERIGDCAN
jgi:hypothetical protein